MNNYDLQGKVALVTGGSGIGRDHRASIEILKEQFHMPIHIVIKEIQILVIIQVVLVTVQILFLNV